ncbi:MAG: hypothetical protein NZ889_00780 [Candidatus Pacearchaeota archaeon]|nr:hypothetical protein [Candidatus Pacearchaeota archaeon]
MYDIFIRLVPEICNYYKITVLEKFIKAKIFQKRKKNGRGTTGKTEKT